MRLTVLSTSLTAAVLVISTAYAMPKRVTPHDHASSNTLTPVGNPTGLSQCNSAASGSNSAWTNFCSTSKYVAPQDNTRPARCHAMQFSSVTEKKNFCYNEFGD